MRLDTVRSRSLATVGVGEPVLVEHVLFDVVRSRCATLGVAAGDIIWVLACTADDVRLRTARGASVVLERALTHFVGVVTPPSTIVQEELPLTPTRRHDEEERRRAIAAA